MKRLDFIKRISTVAVVGLPIVALANSCSTTADVLPVPTNNCLLNGTDTSIGSNHGHSLTVSAADVASATQKTYKIQGSGSHDHMVTISADSFAKLKNDNTTIQVVSSSGSGHTHTVTVSCA